MKLGTFGKLAILPSLFIDSILAIEPSKRDKIQCDWVQTYWGNKLSLSDVCDTSFDANASVDVGHRNRFQCHRAHCCSAFEHEKPLCDNYHLCNNRHIEKMATKMKITKNEFCHYEADDLAHLGWFAPAKIRCMVATCCTERNFGAQVQSNQCFEYDRRMNFRKNLANEHWPRIHYGCDAYKLTVLKHRNVNICARTITEDQISHYTATSKSGIDHSCQRAYCCTNLKLPYSHSTCDPDLEIPNIDRTKKGGVLNGRPASSRPIAPPAGNTGSGSGNPGGRPGQGAGRRGAGNGGYGTRHGPGAPPQAPADGVKMHPCDTKRAKWVEDLKDNNADAFCGNNTFLDIMINTVCDTNDADHCCDDAGKQEISNQLCA